MRRESILAVARRIYEAELSIPTVERIAEEAQMAKGTVYLYFQSREEIYLEIAAALLIAWKDDVERGLAGLSPHESDPEKWAALLVRYPLKNPALFQLHSMKPTLEQNSSAEAVQQGMNQTARVLVQGAAILEDLVGQRGVTLMMQIYAMLAGVWQINVPMLVRLRKEGRPIFRGSWKSFVTDAVALLIRGAMESAPQR